jgi:two-component sensor histidine kinase
MKEYDLAEYHLLMQGRLDTLIGTQWGLGFHFDFMGYLRRMQGRLEEAYQSHLTALSIREGLESHYNISETRSHLCDILLEMERYPEAIKQANLILADKDLHNSLSHQQNAHATLARAYEALGNYRLGLEQQKAYKLISDSILNQDILEKVAEKDAKFDLAEQRNKVALLDAENTASVAVIAQKNKTIWIGTAALIIFGLLILGLYILVRKYLRQKLALSSALSAKELLLKEIHHRVKNNLQIVSSLLSLQSRSVSDAGVLKAINEGKSRVRSMALIHQNLYQGENLTGVEVKPYLEKLCSELFSTYKIDSDEVELELQIDPISLDVDTLVPFGLIINELITNSLKYAFPKSQAPGGADLTGEGISILLREEGSTLLLEVCDTGIGYETEQNSDNDGFGQKLLTSLSKQLGAELQIKSDDNGTCNRLVITKYKKAG